MTATIAPLEGGSVTSPLGFTAAAAHAGLKAGGVSDVALLVSATSCATAGLFTRNAVRAAPVLYDSDLLSERPGRIRAVAMIVGGIAKGAGMIHPDLATLLAVLTTDAAGEAAILAPMLRRVADRTFNAISVDRDTSTNDTVLLLANGAAGIDPSHDGALAQVFEDAVQQVARTLALAIVADGEGATKLVEIHVTGAPTETAAREVGRAIARSALVKTAVYGADPNWGRILAAAGAAGVGINPDKLSLAAAADGEAGGGGGEAGGGGGESEWITPAQGGATAHPGPARA